MATLLTYWVYVAPQHAESPEPDAFRQVMPWACLPIRPSLGHRGDADVARNDHKRKVSLPTDLVRYVGNLVETRAYEAGGEAFRPGGLVLRARNAAMEAWVLAQVIPLLGAFHLGSGEAAGKAEQAADGHSRHAAFIGAPSETPSQAYPTESRGRRNS